MSNTVLSIEQIETLSRVSSLDKAVIIKDLFKDILSIEHFENLLNLTPFTSVKRFSPTYTVPEYTWDVPDWSSGTDHWPIGLIEHFVNSGICYIRDCSRVNATINSICGTLEKCVKRPVDAHIYFSRFESNDRGFGIHNDAAHNFIVQVQGETEWRVGSKAYKNGDRNISEFNDDDSISLDTILKPGDAIFVPAYFYHSAKSLSKRISISFPIPADNLPSNFEERKWINWNA